MGVLQAADVGRPWAQDAQLLAAFRRSVVAKVWDDAAAQPNGGGLQGGQPDFSAVRGLQRKYDKDGANSPAMVFG